VEKNYTNEILRLLKEDRRTIKEAAEILGISVDAVRAALDS
jgi:predicted ArsR family transcriptional regulator